MLSDNFFTKEESNHDYTTLFHATPRQEYAMEIYEKTVTVPRMISWYKNKNNSGADLNRPDWTPDLPSIKDRVEKETEGKFNSVLLNLYRNGKDCVGWHSDREQNFDPNAIITSVSFGETRMFHLCHKFRNEISPVEIPLYHGSLLLMAGTTPSFWQHQVPKTTKDILPRINFTFRQIVRSLQQINY